jgi:hypothetical protein
LTPAGLQAGHSALKALASCPPDPPILPISHSASSLFDRNSNIYAFVSLGNIALLDHFKTSMLVNILFLSLPTQSILNTRSPEIEYTFIY